MEYTINYSQVIKFIRDVVHLRVRLLFTNLQRNGKYVQYTKNFEERRGKKKLFIYTFGKINAMMF
jgi:hypothetical protein